MAISSSSPSRRFGNRAAIEQPGVLSIGSHQIRGVIRNVGLRGAFFAADELPDAGARGVLERSGGRGVKVRVIWQRDDGESGVGLAFDN